MSNTLNSHRLIDYAGQHGKQDEVVEALFKAYFEEGKNLGDLALLIEIGKKAGLPAVRRRRPAWAPFLPNAALTLARAAWRARRVV